MDRARRNTVLSIAAAAFAVAAAIAAGPALAEPAPVGDIRSVGTDSVVAGSYIVALKGTATAPR